MRMQQVQKGASGLKVVGGNGVAANIIYSDVAACNAIIHLIDAVLSPAAAVQAPTAMPAAAAMAPSVAPVAHLAAAGR